MRVFSRVVTYAVPFLPALLALGTAGTAHAHAQLESSTPTSGAALTDRPSVVRLGFSEVPASTAAVQVFDGCDRDVTGRVSRTGRTLAAAVQGGQPGEWVVRYSLLSDTDGHPSASEVIFRVAGPAACSPAPRPSPVSASQLPASASPGAVPSPVALPDSPSDSPSDGPTLLPVVLLAGFGTVLLGGAVLVRRALHGRG